MTDKIRKSITDLPVEIIPLIAQNLGFDSIVNTKCTCRYIFSALNNHSFEKVMERKKQTRLSDHFSDLLYRNQQITLSQSNHLIDRSQEYASIESFIFHDPVTELRNAFHALEKMAKRDPTT